MNKFYKKYVCYDPNLTRFSELGNVALNKTFWERTYATTKKFSHIVPGVSDSIVPYKDDIFIKARDLPRHSIPKMRSLHASSDSEYMLDVQVSKRSGTKKTCSFSEDNHPTKPAKKMRTLVLLPEPPVANVCPFDECWPQNSLAATQSLPNVKHFHPLSKVPSAQRRVSRLPSLTKIVEMEGTQHTPVDRSHESSFDSEQILVSSFDALTPYESDPVLKKRSMSYQERRSESTKSIEMSASICTPRSPKTVTKLSLSVKPSKEAQGINSGSETSLPAFALIVKDRMEFWKERRPKKEAPSINELGKKCARKRVCIPLVHRNALLHPVRRTKQNENIFENASQPSQSLTSILDSYVSIPILKRVAIYTSLHKERLAKDINSDAKQTSDTVTL